MMPVDNSSLTMTQKRRRLSLSTSQRTIDNAQMGPTTSSQWKKTLLTRSPPPLEPLPDVLDLKPPCHKSQSSLTRFGEGPIPIRHPSWNHRAASTAATARVTRTNNPHLQWVRKVVGGSSTTTSTATTTTTTAQKSSITSKAEGCARVNSSTFEEFEWLEKPAWEKDEEYEWSSIRRTLTEQAIRGAFSSHCEGLADCEELTNVINYILYLATPPKDSWFSITDRRSLNDSIIIWNIAMHKYAKYIMDNIVFLEDCDLLASRERIFTGISIQGRENYRYPTSNEMMEYRYLFLDFLATGELRFYLFSYV